MTASVAVPEESADAEIVDDVPAFPHPVIIEWPARRAGGFLLPGWAITISDAVTGEQITTVTRFDVVLHADAAKVITADLTMLADEDGNPLASGARACQRDGEILTGTFRAVIAEMRVRGQGSPESGSALALMT